MELLAGKHSCLGSVKIAASNFGLFLDRDFMWHVVVALPVKGVLCWIHISLWPSCVIPHSHPSACLDCGCPIQQPVLRPIYLKIVAAMMEKHSCDGFKSEGGRGILWWGRGGERRTDKPEEKICIQHTWGWYFSLSGKEKAFLFLRVSFVWVTYYPIVVFQLVLTGQVTEVMSTLVN